MSPDQRTDDNSRPSDLPEGALLVVAAVAAAGAMLAVPFALAALLILLRHVLGLPARWFALACALLSLALVPDGLQAAIDGYVSAAPVWRVAAMFKDDPRSRGWPQCCHWDCHLPEHARWLVSCGTHGTRRFGNQGAT